ncbi:MAG: hypothetical protein ABI968_05895 [Acidobacteriota bacterium]
MKRRVVLVVEDGVEYTEGFARLSGGGERADFVRAGNASEARGILSDRLVDAVFLDMVFDRTPQDQLVGDVAGLMARFGGDRAQAMHYLARHEGFYLIRELSPLIPAGARVILAYDFSSDPERLGALRASLPSLEGLPEGITLSQLVARLLED